MSMTHKQRLLAAMAGKAVDRLPFVPRMDTVVSGQ